MGLVVGATVINYCITTSRIIFSAKRKRCQVASKLYARDHFKYKTFTVEAVDETVGNMAPTTIETILNATISELRCLMAKESSSGGISPVAVLAVYITRARSLGREYRSSTVRVV